jgi:hypothetical protein
VSPRKRCSVCLQLKPWTDYWAAAKNPDGTMARPQYRCKECVKADRRARRRVYPELFRARDRADWRKLMADPERRVRRRETQRQNSATFRAKQREQTPFQRALRGRSGE